MANRQKVLEIAETIDYVCMVLEGKVRRELARLLFGTVAKESDFTHVVQIGGGPARGYFQMEPDTAMDIRKNWLIRKHELVDKVVEKMGPRFENAFRNQNMLKCTLATDLFFSCVMARFQYQRVPDPIPAGLVDRSMYWKEFYNTPEGDGTAEEFVEAWNYHKCDAWCRIMGWV